MVSKLSIGLSMIIILVEDHSSTNLACWKDKDVGIGPEGVEDLVLNKGSAAIGDKRFGEVGLRCSG